MWDVFTDIILVIVTDGAASSAHMASSAGGTCEQTEHIFFDFYQFTETCLKHQTSVRCVSNQERITNKLKWNESS